MSVDPALFREISQLTKQDKDTYKDVSMEILDSPAEETKQWVN